MHEVLVNRLGGLSLPRKSVVRLTDRPDMTLDVYRGRKTTTQHNTTSYLVLLLDKYMNWLSVVRQIDSGCHGKRIDKNLLIYTQSVQISDYR